MAMPLHCVTPEAELSVDLLFSSDVEVDMDARLSSLERFRCSEILQQPGIIAIESQEPTRENIQLLLGWFPVTKKKPLSRSQTKLPQTRAVQTFSRINRQREPSLV
jgi:hypothetical protein